MRNTSAKQSGYNGGKFIWELSCESMLFMSLKSFNDAIEAAQAAYTAGDEEAFKCAVTDAQRTIQADSSLCQMLSRAVEAFPNIEALMLISRVCLEFPKAAR